MRFVTIFTTACCTVALILSFLSLFAGNRPGFLGKYGVLTFNTSRIGADFLDPNNTSAQGARHNINTFFHSHLDLRKSNTTSLAQALGLMDFYSVHLLNWCDGTFVPTPVYNATLPKKRIGMSVTYCSPMTAFYAFDPAAVLNESLAYSHTGITLDDLGWPAKLQSGLRRLRATFRAAAWFLCWGIVFAAARFAVALAQLSVRMTERLPVRKIELVSSNLAWLCLGLASAMLTAVAVQGAAAVNKYGEPISVSADRGSDFCIVVWCATLLMMLAAGAGAWAFLQERRQDELRALEGRRSMAARRSMAESRLGAGHGHGGRRSMAPSRGTRGPSMMVVERVDSDETIVAPPERSATRSSSSSAAVKQQQQQLKRAGTVSEKSGLVDLELKAPRADTPEPVGSRPGSAAGREWATSRFMQEI